MKCGKIEIGVGLLYIKDIYILIIMNQSTVILINMKINGGVIVRKYLNNKSVKKLVLSFIVFFILILTTACTNNKTEDVLNNFENTVWQTKPNAIYFEVFYDSMVMDIDVIPSTTPADIDLDNFDPDKYISGHHKNIFIEKTGKNLKIYNDDELDLEFKIISENELEDKDGNVFTKQ